MLTRRIILGLSVGALTIGGKARGQIVELSLKVEFSSDRDQIGSLVLLKRGARVAGPFKAYGRSDTQRAVAHQNPTRDPKKLYGDTPTGTYAIPRAIATGPGTAYNSHSYGKNGALVLVPATGDAALAAANGRVGLLIHGGDPGSNGRLRATHGCIRLANSDMAALMAAIIASGQNPRFNRCEVTRIEGTVGEAGDFTAGEDAGDPPPGIEKFLGSGSVVLP